ncbi:hypothetical protein KCTC32516_01053 [Polaribacter huanghezhanensis]|uniref:hypothetical protein n=1 Tax=Polaribacter huanghezhanensis TaxID=1354726 RepID=UPI0026483FD6|nr:hypothetical protein [Polaribacter huanghezhanensis]WKD85708.1 hypothetical protein KCTC32516_01053 [Polaribacter huanghezhanensis]
MKNNLSKILNIFIALVALVGAILFIRIFMEDSTAIETNMEVQNSVISPIIWFSTSLLYLAIGIAVIMSIGNLIKNPESLKKTLFGLVALGVILVLAYFTGDSLAVTDPQGKILPGGEAGSSVNQWVSTGIWYSIFLGIIAGGFFVFDLVKGLIKS